MFKINAERIEKIAKVLRSIGYGKILLLEENDPQYKAVGRLLYSSMVKDAVAAIVANALISYRLSGEGEKYWSEFSEYFSTRLKGSRQLAMFREFLEKYSKYNRFLREQKLNRLRKFYGSSLYAKLKKDPLHYCDKLNEFNKELASIFKKSSYSKTIVFATKMYYYVCRNLGYGVKPEKSIPIPVDRRVCFISLTSGIIENTIVPHSLKHYIEELMKKYAKLVVKAWGIVSEKTYIPPLNIDSIIWLSARFIRLHRNVKEIVEAFMKDYGSIISRDLLEKLFYELAYLLVSHRILY